MQRSSAPPVLGDFDKLLPAKITGASVRCGNEWVIPLRHATEAVNIAGEHLIAVLGVEIPRILPTDSAWKDIPGTSSSSTNDWGAFVFQNNQAAAQYIAENQFGEGYGYTLTTTSGEEFGHPQRSDKMSNGKFVILKIKRQNTPSPSRTGKSSNSPGIRA